MSNHLVMVYPPKISASYTGDMSLALFYLMGSARDSGLCDNIMLFDFNAPIGTGKTIEELLTVLAEFSREGETVVAINCLFSALFPSVREIAKKIKQQYPFIKITTGGMHPTLFAKEIIDNCPDIDAVGIGESDLTFPKLLRYFFHGEGEAELESVCLRIDGKTVLKPKTSYIQNLDSLPNPGYEFYHFQDYAVHTSNWWNPDGIRISPYQLPLLTSRSCPNKCNFCSMWLVMGDRFRSRSAEHVFAEIKYLYDTYGVTYFKIADDNLTLNRERIVKICKLIIDSGIKVYFDTANGIALKTLDEGVVHLMRQAGFIMVALAVESGSDHIRNTIMGKRISREQIVNAFKWCRGAGMNTTAFFIIGMPEDTEDTLRETTELIQEIDASRLFIHVAKPFPGTRLFNQCVRDNLLIGGYDPETLWTGEAEANSSKDQESFTNILLNHTSRQFWIRPYHLSLERLEEQDIEIQKISYQKSQNWYNHIRENHKELK